jgi:hypothetical protein
MEISINSLEEMCDLMCDNRVPEPPKCNMCNANSEVWEYKTVPYNFGELGNYELTMSVSNNGMWIEFCREKEDPLFQVHFKDIKYCPYCGRKLVKE